eukprot:jgi/Mesen1/5938/ME000301S05066
MALSRSRTLYKGCAPFIHKNIFPPSWQASVVLSDREESLANPRKYSAWSLAQASAPANTSQALSHLLRSPAVPFAAASSLFRQDAEYLRSGLLPSSAGVRWSSSSTGSGQDWGRELLPDGSGSGMEGVISETVGAVGEAVSQVGKDVAHVASESSMIVAGLQHFMDNIHLQTGLPWWLSIAAATVAIRLAVLPLMIHQMRSSSRLVLLQPEMKVIVEKMKASSHDPKVAEMYQQRLKGLFKKHGTSPLAPFLGILIQAPLFICFYFAIQGMAEGVESFKTGGALWFTDLSVADATYALPILSALSFLATVEMGAVEGMQGNPNAARMKNLMRLLAVAMVPLTSHFSAALFCYWMPSNFMSLMQGLVLKRKSVKQMLGMPSAEALAAAAAAGAGGALQPPPGIATLAHKPPSGNAPRRKQATVKRRRGLR